jgi:tetratricopeptide (TPR) repeat protein
MSSAPPSRGSAGAIFGLELPTYQPPRKRILRAGRQQEILTDGFCCHTPATKRSAVLSPKNKKHEEVDVHEERIPTFVWSWGRSGWLNTYLGNVEAALRDFEQATRLDPGGPNAIRLTGLGCAYFGAGRYEEAARCKRMALSDDPGKAWINRTLSVSYARLGDRLAALESVEALRRYSPDITINRILAALPFTPDYLDRVAEGVE